MSFDPNDHPGPLEQAEQPHLIDGRWIRIPDSCSHFAGIFDARFVMGVQIATDDEGDVETLILLGDHQTDRCPSEWFDLICALVM